MPVNASGDTTIALRCYICMVRDEMVLPASILNKQEAVVNMAKSKGWYFVMEDAAGAWCCPECEDKKRYLKVKPGAMRNAEQQLQGANALRNAEQRPQGAGAQPPALSPAICRLCAGSVPNAAMAYDSGWIRFGGDEGPNYWKCKACNDIYVPTRSAVQSHLVECLGCSMKVARSYAASTGWKTSYRGNTEIFRCRVCHERNVKVMAPVAPTSIAASTSPYAADPQYRAPFHREVGSSNFTGPVGDDVARCADCNDWQMKYFASRNGWVWSAVGTGTVCRCPKCYKVFKDKKPDQSATNADYRPSLEVKTGVKYLAARSRYPKKPEEVKA